VRKPLLVVLVLLLLQKPTPTDLNKHCRPQLLRAAAKDRETRGAIIIISARQGSSEPELSQPA
jgi:hypothetical protein